jgi:hypothetical protein
MSVSSIPAPQAPRAKPRFIFSDSSGVIDAYESFAKEGFASDDKSGRVSIYV